jgi:phosphoserine phosphatase RsbU/P
MAASTLTIIDAAPASERRDWSAWFARSWPEPPLLPMPHVRVAESAAAALETTGELGQIAVLVAHTEEALTGLYQLVDALDQRCLALLVLAGEEVEVEDRLAGLPWSRLGAPASEIMARIETMFQRQEVVERLSAEMTLARRLQGGATGEMNRMHEELELAATVQREFLPRELPQVGNLEVAALFRPSSYVSGDIYNVEQLDENHVGFFIADATGHGVPAALMTVLISRSLSFQRRESDGGGFLSPAQAIERLNRDLVSRSGGHQRFATAVCGIIDVSTNKLTLASAGHPPPLIVSDDETREVKTSGSLLGVFPDESYEDTAIRLREGERLVIYSDGFELAFPSEGQDIRERRLPTSNYVSEFTQLGQGPLQQAMDSLEHRLDEQAGSLHQVDDLTILVIAAGAPLGVGHAVPARTGVANEID